MYRIELANTPHRPDGRGPDRTDSSRFNY